METVLGLGSNVGNRLVYLSMAIKALAYDKEAVLHRIRLSRIYEAEALLPDGAPQSWDKPFLNMAVAGHTTVEPDALFQKIKDIERSLGREDKGHWGPRKIDIDILAMENEVMESDILTIPHPQLTKRAFVLLPMADIVPGWRYPVPGPKQGMTIKELARACEDHLEIRPIERTVEI